MEVHTHKGATAMASTVVISPMIQSMVRSSTNWCAICEHPKSACLCHPDVFVREDSSVLKFMQSPTDPSHGNDIVRNVAAHLLGRDGFALLVAIGLSSTYKSEIYLHSELARLSRRVRLDAITASGYDYENQAWVTHGKYVSCSHPLTTRCGCFGRLHAGENVRA